MIMTNNTETFVRETVQQKAEMVVRRTRHGVGVLNNNFKWIAGLIFITIV